MDDEYLNNEYKDVSVWKDAIVNFFSFFHWINVTEYGTRGFIVAAYQFRENINAFLAFMSFAREYMTGCW